MAGAGKKCRGKDLEGATAARDADLGQNLWIGLMNMPLTRSTDHDTEDENRLSPAYQDRPVTRTIPYPIPHSWWPHRRHRPSTAIPPLHLHVCQPRCFDNQQCTGEALKNAGSFSDAYRPS